MMHSTVIEVREVEKSFSNVRAVRKAGFSVERGSITALLGPNGAGKTTVLRMLLDLIRPDAGEIGILGMDPRRDSLKIRQRLGYVPENRAFSPNLTVDQVIGVFRGLSSGWNPRLENELIESFDLPRCRRCRELSRGMASQLALVLALAPEPEVLVLDEPVSGLDPVLRRRFMQSVLSEVAARERTVLLSSHNLSEVERVADAIVLMNRGEVLLTGPMEAVKEREKKVRVVPQGELPDEVREHSAVVSARREGRAWLLGVSGDVDGLIEEIQRHCPFAVEVLDMNLEDIFISRSEGGE